MGLNKKLAVFNLERESFVKLLKVPGWYPFAEFAFR